MAIDHTDDRRSSMPRSELERLAWPKLESEQIDRLREVGVEHEVEAGHVFFDVGQDGYDFIQVLRGSVEIVDRTNDRVVATIEAPDFVGELGMLTGQGTFMAGIAGEDSHVIVVPQDELRGLVATVPEISDAIVTAFAARRRLLIEWGQGGLVIVGRETDPETVRLLEFASRSNLPYRFVDRSEDAALAELSAATELPADGLAAITSREAVLTRPEPRDVARALGLDLAASDDEPFDIVVVGAGPAGLASSVYGASEGLRTLTVEDTAIGGQAGTSSRIENYLGFSTGISGSDLAFQAEIQAIKFGARVTVPRRAVSLARRDDGDFRIELDDGTSVVARAVILANGVQYRRLPLDGLEGLEGAGVYYAATELEARFCAGSDVVIVGGANSAGQAAMYLSRTASCTHVVVRGDGLSETMSSYLSSRILDDARIEVWTRTEVSAVGGEGQLERVTLRNRETGEETTMDVGALFIMIGAQPNTDWLHGFLELDEKGFIVTGRDGDPFVTSEPGVYAVGDIRSGSVKRVASAVGEGSVVVSGVHRYLTER